MPQTQSAPVVKIPAALSMLLKSFGIEPEKVAEVANGIISTGESILSNGTLDKVLGALETLERIETKLDSLLEKIENGKSESGGK